MDPIRPLALMAKIKTYKPKVPYGCLLAGPPCGLFVFMSSSYHRRTDACVYGDETLFKIRESNQIVVNLAILLCVAHARMIFYLLFASS